MSAVTTTVDSTPGGVKIAWTAPNSNSYPLDLYLIEIVDKTGSTWTEDLTDCDGSDPTIFANRYCIVPMTTLAAAPYNYVLGDLIGVRASAHNSLGYSAVSSTNTAGAQLRTAPTTMNLPIRGSDTSES
jgi:hypothetical protein